MAEAARLWAAVDSAAVAGAIRVVVVVLADLAVEVLEAAVRGEAGRGSPAS